MKEQYENGVTWNDVRHSVRCKNCRYLIPFYLVEKTSFHHLIECVLYILWYILTKELPTYIYDAPNISNNLNDRFRNRTYTNIILLLCWWAFYGFVVYKIFSLTINLF